jgi:hypothetical protein
MRRRLSLSNARVRSAIDRRAHAPSAAPGLLGATAPATRRFVSVVLIVALITIGGLAVLATWVAALLAFVVACCLALDLIVAGMSSEDAVLRRFRRQLAALPETVHPQGY